VGHDTFDRSLTPLGTLASSGQSNGFPAPTVFNGAATGTLDLRIGGTFRLAQAAESHIALAGRQTMEELVSIP
jgi:hypothetical protein